MVTTKHKSKESSPIKRTTVPTFNENLDKEMEEALENRMADVRFIFKSYPEKTIEQIAGHLRVAHSYVAYVLKRGSVEEMENQIRKDYGMKNKEDNNPR